MGMWYRDKEDKEKGEVVKQGYGGVDFVIRGMKRRANSKGIDDNTTKRLWLISYYGGSVDV